MHEALVGSSVGAFLAAIFGICTQLYINKLNNKSEAKKIIQEIRELNEAAKWRMKLQSEEELTREISIYQFKKNSGEIIELELANYQGKDKRG